MATKKVRSIKEIISSSPITVTEGVTIEKLNPMFFNTERLKKQPEPIYRMDSSGHRYYYRFTPEGEPKFYTSVTTFIKNTLPTPPQLIKFIADMGVEESKAFTQERAYYGTFLHAQCCELLITGKYDLNSLSDKLTVFMTKERAVVKPGWVDDLKKDVLAFAQFMIEKNVKPLAIEIILYHPTDGYAGAIDLVLDMDDEQKGFFGELYLSGFNKGQPKESKRTVRITAILDIKSGRKGFYESAEIQLKAYHEMWKEHFPDVKIDKLLNWSPKDYRGKIPTYNLKDQTESANLCKLPHLVKLAKIEDDKRTNMVTIINGNIDLTKGLDGLIEELTFAELIKKNK